MQRNSIILYLFSLMLTVTTINSDQLLAQTPAIITAWSPNQETDLSHYIIYRDTTPGTMIALDTIPNTDTTYQDVSVQPGETYYYKLTAVDNADNESEPSEEVMVVAGVVSFVNVNEGNVIEKFELKQNYPNPFNPKTTIEYNLPEQSYVTVKVYDVLGKEIKTLVDGNKEAGSYRIKWDGSDNTGRSVSSGVYFYQMMAGNFNQVKKSIFQK